MTPELLFLAGGAVIGFFTGRWWAELGRGRHDAEQAWRRRRSYRDKD